MIGPALRTVLQQTYGQTRVPYAAAMHIVKPMQFKAPVLVVTCRLERVVSAILLTVAVLGSWATSPSLSAAEAWQSPGSTNVLEGANRADSLEYVPQRDVIGTSPGYFSRFYQLHSSYAEADRADLPPNNWTISWMTGTLSGLPPESEDSLR